jgi:hypothetical protein
MGSEYGRSIDESVISYVPGKVVRDATGGDVADCVCANQHRQRCDPLA